MNSEVQYCVRPKRSENYQPAPAVWLMLPFSYFASACTRHQVAGVELPTADWNEWGMFGKLFAAQGSDR